MDVIDLLASAGARPVWTIRHEQALNGEPSRSRTISLTSSASTPVGVPVRSESASSAGSPESKSRLKAPSMRCWIAMAWWSAALACVTALREPLCPWASIPMNCGVPITRGEFLLGDRQYCYPLTVTDHASRYLLSCEALSSTKEEYAFTVFERLFQKRGLPFNIHSDNGVPFASAHALPVEQARGLVASVRDWH